MMFALIIYWFNYTIKNIAFDDSFYQTGIVGSAGEVKLAVRQAVKTVNKLLKLSLLTSTNLSFQV